MLARDPGPDDRRKARAKAEIRRVPPGTFRAGASDLSRGPGNDRRRSDSPALVVVLAPFLGLGIWGAILYLLLS